MRPKQASPFLNVCGALGVVLAGCTAQVSKGMPVPTGQADGAAPNGSGGNGAGNSVTPSGADAGPSGMGGASSGTGGGGIQPGTGGSSAVGAGGAAGTTVVAVCDSLTNRRLRRLSVREYGNVLLDLLGAKFQTMARDALPFEPRLGGFDNQDSALFVSGSLQETIADLAAAVAAAADPVVLAPCATAAGTPACLQTFIRSFANKAYGRPLLDAEFTRINTVAAMGENYATSVRLVVELALQSPHFLYVSELGAPEIAAASGKAVPLTPQEIASQLSFLLNGSRPDAKLLQAADTTRFARPEDIRVEAERLLATTRAGGELSRFILGWLDMAPIADAPKAPEAFPALTPSVLTGMQVEFDQFVTTQLKGGEGTLAGFMTAQSANIPPALATIYGTDLKGTVLDPKHRLGVLSLPGLLAYHSSDHHSGPVERGLFVRQQLLCQPVPAPPPDAVMRIAANPINPDDKTLTTRQKFAAHVNEPSCVACHAFFDPIGFGLEQMDGIGRFRTTENGLPVDSKGELSRTDVNGLFEGVADLSTKLAQSKMFETCMVDHFFRFSQSRPTVATDQCVVQQWNTTFSAGGGRIKDLVLASVVHRTFANRRDDR